MRTSEISFIIIGGVILIIVAFVLILGSDELINVVGGGDDRCPVDAYCHVFKTDIDKVYINFSDSDIDKFMYRVEM
jgi:hypothetical protein